MNTEQLSRRLAKVASFVKQNANVADIGSDHAYLPCFLVTTGKIQKAVAGEVVKGPFESAIRNVRGKGLSEAITVRLANGLSAIEANDGIDTITIAGMGGALIATILEQGSDRLEKIERLIVQPNIHSKAIRKWAVGNGWKIIDEAILKEDDKIYEILVLEKGDALYDELELLVGPVLLKSKTPEFIEKWTRESVEWNRVLNSLENAEETEAIHLKKQQLADYIKLVGKVL